MGAHTAPPSVAAEWVYCSSGLASDGVDHGMRTSDGVDAPTREKVRNFYQKFVHAVALEQSALPNEALLWFWSTSSGEKRVVIVRKKPVPGRLAFNCVALLFRKNDFDKYIKNPFRILEQRGDDLVLKRYEEGDNHPVTLNLPVLPPLRDRISVDRTYWQGDKVYSETNLSEWKEVCTQLASDGEVIPSFATCWPHAERSVTDFEVVFRLSPKTRLSFEGLSDRVTRYYTQITEALPNTAAMQKAGRIENIVSGMGGRNRKSQEEWEECLDTIAETARSIANELSIATAPHFQNLRDNYEALANEVVHVRKPLAANEGTSPSDKEKKVTKKPASKPRKEKTLAGKYPQKMGKVALVTTVLALSGAVYYGVTKIPHPPNRDSKPTPMTEPEAFRLLDKWIRKEHWTAQNGVFDGVKGLVRAKKTSGKYTLSGQKLSDIINGKEKDTPEKMELRRRVSHALATLLLYETLKNSLSSKMETQALSKFFSPTSMVDLNYWETCSKSLDTLPEGKNGGLSTLNGSLAGRVLKEGVEASREDKSARDRDTTPTTPPPTSRQVRKNGHKKSEVKTGTPKIDRHNDKSKEDGSD